MKTLICSRFLQGHVMILVRSTISRFREGLGSKLHALSSLRLGFLIAAIGEEKKAPYAGLEPATCGLTVRRSTTKLIRQQSAHIAALFHAFPCWNTPSSEQFGIEDLGVEHLDLIDDFHVGGVQHLLILAELRRSLAQRAHDLMRALVHRDAADDEC